MTTRKEPLPLLLPALALSVGLGLAPAMAAAGYKDGSYTGQSFSAYYGQVQVRADVSGGKLTHVQILQAPYDRRTSRIIAGRSLPVLEREAIQAQTSHVNFVSGASLTSRAFIESLHTALEQAL